MEIETDEYCNEIFTFLVANRNRIRFNRLHETLNGLDVKITKPTLIAHLHHLLAKGSILQKKEGRQNTTYQVNWKKFEYLNEAIEFKTLIANKLKDEKTFKSSSLEYQIAFVHGILSMLQLYYLQLSILSIECPRAKSINNLGALLIHRLYDNYRLWLLDTCKQSKENIQKALDLLDKKTEEYQNLLFKHSPNLPQPNHDVPRHPDDT